MSGYNMPPGVSTNDIPGNTADDVCEVCGEPISRVCHVISLAQQHVEAKHDGSAILALEDAQSLHMQGNDEHALRRALTSLRYSVGILHPDYQAAVEP